MDLCQIGEFGLIDRIRKRFPPSKRSLLVGIGDDSAVLRPKKDMDILLTTDLLVEDIHFDLKYTTFRELGYKALAVNISDIAAMGGIPRYLVVSLAIPGGLDIKDIDELYKGIGILAKRFGINLAGGDTSASKKGIFISITLLGDVEPGIVIARSGASVGDSIIVTGNLGDSSAGLEVLKKRENAGRGYKYLKKRHLMPIPRVDEGRLLATNKLATSMIDISDGLLSDLSHILDESGVGAELFLDKIPISAPLRRYAARVGASPLRFALSGGEDYELLLTASKASTQKVVCSPLLTKTGVSVIGRITKHKGIKWAGDYKIEEDFLKGYDHFKKG
ncbi:MAG: thiamine-phosphate kinase [Nitrospirae bacterium]|nr:thiamine-phosphate kinase [Nitrospirota bacterium]